MPRFATQRLSTMSSIRHLQRARRPLPTAVRLVLGLAVLVSIGTLLLMLPGVGRTRPLTLAEAMFTATSALTVTGLATIVPATDLSLLGQVLLMVEVQVGGVGFMVIAVIVLAAMGRRVEFIDRLALRDSLGLLSPRAILSLTRRVMVGVLIIELVGAILLWLNWRRTMSDGTAFIAGLFHSITGFCNAGFELFSGRPGFPDGMPNDAPTVLVMSALIILGGLGIPVWGDLLSWPRRRATSLHTRVTLTLVVILLLGGAALLWLVEGTSGILKDEPWWRQALLSFYQSTSARTAGFMAVSTFADLRPASQMLMIALMFVGSAPASMGGGITTGTLAVLALSVLGYTRGQVTPTIFGRRLSERSVPRAAAVVSISLAVVATATWLLLAVNPTAVLEEALFEVVSAFATTGLSLNYTSRMNWAGQLIIMFVMFWGRLGALTIIVALTRQQPTPAVTFPEEPMLMG